MLSCIWSHIIFEGKTILSAGVFIMHLGKNLLFLRAFFSFC